MSEAEVLYSDVKFTRKKRDTTEVASSSFDTTYSEVKILGSQPSNELPASQQVVSNEGSKVKSKKVALLIFCIILAVVVIAFCYVLHQALKNTDHSCPKCDKGWEEFRGKCYYFSNKTSSWNESRRYCQSRGGDLVKIDSEEEQRFLTKEVKFHEDMFWIGLTDSEKESKWFWVDGSPLNTSLTFWGKGQPDDWKGVNPEGQDCVRMGGKETKDLKCWFDGNCNYTRKSICEKQTLNCT